MLVYRNFISKIVVVLALFSAVPVFAQNSDDERVGVIKGIVGDVKVRKSPSYSKVRRETAIAAGPKVQVDAKDTIWAEARLNMAVREKDEIMTGAQSEVMIETPEGNEVKLSENSVMEIAVLRYGAGGRPKSTDKRNNITSTKFKVAEGSIIASVKKLLNSKSSFKFETPTATAAIRGTVLELDVTKGANTVIMAFEGVILVAPAGYEKFVELRDGKMAEIAPGQKTVIIKDIPKNYKRRSTKLKAEDGKKPAKDAKAQPSGSAASDDSVSVKLSIDLGDAADTVKCYTQDSITVEGVVSPASAKVSVNGVAAAPDKNGVFKMSLRAPSDSGVYPITIVAEDKKLSETLIRTMKVAHVYTAVKLIAPAEGHTVVGKPVVVVSGTALPGSKVHVSGVTLNVKRDGTFSGEVPIPGKEGNVTLSVEIVDAGDNAVWIERHIKYRKK
jgi:hypothetical protein